MLVAATILLIVAWFGLSRAGRQALAIGLIGLSTLGQRAGMNSVIVVGIAGVVGVLVALFAMAAGFEAALGQAGDRQSAIILRKGASAELNSSLDRQAITLIRAAPGVARDSDGQSIASAEVVVIANLPKRSTGTDANIELRGVGPKVWALRDEARIIAGRAFKPGLRELIAGRGASGQFAGTGIGDEIKLGGQSWQIVGVFATGDAHESELWGDAEAVAAAYRRNSFQSVTLRLDDLAAFDRLQAALLTDPRLKVDVLTTQSYYNKQSQRLTKLIRALGTGVAVIMAIGAGFGALNSMYAAVAARSREIATLRALGFGALPVVVAVLLEAMVLALAGGMIGGVIAYLLFNGYTASTLGSNFSQVVFAFQVTPALLGTGIAWALGIGFIGGLFPALKAARMPVAAALRAL